MPTLYNVFRGIEGAEAKVGDDLTASEAVVLMEKVCDEDGTKYVFAQFRTRAGAVHTVSLANMRLNAEIED